MKKRIYNRFLNRTRQVIYTSYNQLNYIFITLIKLYILQLIH